ncbi:uncharacterized protein K441DRAFT_665376 [Cenococcum geophilum 1.58]|uniref:uncharacterized protein n=1 Tax=Cenococcum geophilum 1.58 TaxID=794803 RepID=UPI00358E2A2B|nr:hypothetical protein K441DRAFT_665376 [Cenococcum geophilum 1.58]
MRKLLRTSYSRWSSNIPDIDRFNCFRLHARPFPSLTGSPDGAIRLLTRPTTVLVSQLKKSRNARHISIFGEPTLLTGARFNISTLAMTTVAAIVATSCRQNACRVQKDFTGYVDRGFPLSGL